MDLVFIIDGPTVDSPDEPYDQLENFAPAQTPLNLPEVDRKAKKQNNGDWELTITYEGLPDSDPDIDPVQLLLSKGRGAEIEIDHAGSEDPIEQHPLFFLIANKYGQKIDSYKQFVGFQPTYNDSSGKTVKNPCYGVTHYINDTCILRLTYAVRTFQPSFLKNIAMIDFSLVPMQVFQAIAVEPNTTKSFLKRSVKAQWRGNVWAVSFEWILGDWLPDIYTPAP